MLNFGVFEERGMICSLCTHNCCDTYSGFSFTLWMCVVTEESRNFVKELVNLQFRSSHL